MVCEALAALPAYWAQPESRRTALMLAALLHDVGKMETFTLDENGRIAEVYAWYGKVTGTVSKVEEISVQGTLSNAFVTITLADGTSKRFEIGYEAATAYTGATGEMGKLLLVGNSGLKVGQRITVEYCPYEVNGRVRAIAITD